jgi:hypothetical protein
MLVTLRHLSLARFLAWLSLPTFHWTEWLDLEGNKNTDIKQQLETEVEVVSLGKFFPWQVCQTPTPQSFAIGPDNMSIFLKF